MRMGLNSAGVRERASFHEERRVLAEANRAAVEEEDEEDIVDRWEERREERFARLGVKSLYGLRMQSLSCEFTVGNHLHTAHIYTTFAHACALTVPTST